VPFLRLIAVPLLAGLILPAGALAAGSGGIGVRLVPLAAGTRDPLARSYIVDRLAPGATLRRTIEIRNGTASPTQVAVYVAGADLQGGAFRFASGHTRNELSSWSSVSRSIVILPAGAETAETVSVHVPKMASSGERYAVVWAEVSAPAPTGGGVTLVNRVGVRMYLGIGPGGAAHANFVIGSPTAQRSGSGEPLVVATVRNTGKRTLSIGGTLMLSDGPGGLREGPIPVKLAAALAPGMSAPATVALEGTLPPGPWRADLELNSGFVQRSAVATIRFPAVTPVPAPGSGGRILFVFLFLALLAAVALVILIVRELRRGRDGLAPAI
jgi:hypothetical protein